MKLVHFYVFCNNVYIHIFLGKFQFSTYVFKCSALNKWIIIKSARWRRTKSHLTPNTESPCTILDLNHFYCIYHCLLEISLFSFHPWCWNTNKIKINCGLIFKLLCFVSVTANNSTKHTLYTRLVRIKPVI